MWRSTNASVALASRRVLYGLAIVSVIGGVASAAATPPPIPTPPAPAPVPEATPAPPANAAQRLEIVDLSNQSQSNIAMAKMLFQLGQAQGQVAELKQKTIDADGLRTQLKAAQDRIATLSKPRCDLPGSHEHSSPNSPR